VTARRTRTAATHAAVTRHIDAPIDTVFTLLADVHTWPRWGPFTDIGAAADIDRPGRLQPTQLGRHQLLVALTTPDAPYWLRYRLTAGPARALHTADITLSPADDGGTDLHWRATIPTGLPGIGGIGRRRRAALVTAVTELTAHLASAAEDPATTRLEWAAARRDDRRAARASSDLGRVSQPHPGSRADASRPASLSFAPRRTPLRGTPPPRRIGRLDTLTGRERVGRHALAA
jgi:hypothetical protein